jgi:hypothetical protein
MKVPTIQTCDELRKALSDEIKSELDEILSGNFSLGDVLALYPRLSDPQKGALVPCLVRWGASPKTLRQCLRHVWKVDSELILTALGGSLEDARALFRRAQFPLPESLPAVVTVYRGTAGRTLEQAREGLCWTLARDAACWFATLYERRNAGNPLVVTAPVRRDQILFFDEDDGLHEEEVVLDRISSGDIDPGGEAEWRARGYQYIKKRKRAGL